MIEASANAGTGDKPLILVPVAFLSLDLVAGRVEPRDSLDPDLNALHGHLCMPPRDHRSVLNESPA